MQKSMQAPRTSATNSNEICTHSLGNLSLLFQTTDKTPLLDSTPQKDFETEQENLVAQLLEHQKKLEKLIHSRDEFIAIASHELKTPLTTLKMQLQIVPKTLHEIHFPGKEKFLDLLNQSLCRLDQFNTFIESILDISRINSGQLVLNPQKVSLSEIILKGIEHLQRDLTDSGCVLRTQLDSPMVGSWDPVRIEQIVVNLLSNAIKYGAGKPIEISTQIRGARAILKIKDHGIGISKADQSKIFECFERLTSASPFHGFGLGLYVTRQIVQQHGGSIQVESEINQGSTFTVELPIVS